MIHPRLKGSHYEMGFRYGATLLKRGSRIPEQSPDKISFARQCELLVRDFFPEILEEIRGLAEGNQTPYDQLNSLIMGLGVFQSLPHCSIFAAFDGNEIVVGRNYDYYYYFKKYTESSLVCPEDGYWFTGTSDIFVGKEDGINEKGLVIGMTAVPPIINQPGINFGLATRYVLEKCLSVSDAVQVLSKIKYSTTNNYLVADKTGKMAVIETSPERTEVRWPVEGQSFILCTNHFVHPAMQKMQSEIVKEWDSVARYKAISEFLLLHNGKIDTELAREILSEHDGYVCSHQNRIKMGTIWSAIFTPVNLQVLRAEGHPCVTNYVPDLRLPRELQKQNIRLPD